MLSDAEVADIATYNVLINKLERAVKNEDEERATEISNELLEKYPDVFESLQPIADFINSVKVEVVTVND